MTEATHPIILAVFARHRIPAPIDPLLGLLKEIIAEAEAQGWENAAEVIKIQHRYGGMHITTEAECAQAAITFSNAAYMVRQRAGIPHPSPESHAALIDGEPHTITPVHSPGDARISRVDISSAISDPLTGIERQAEQLTESREADTRELARIIIQLIRHMRVRR